MATLTEKGKFHMTQLRQAAIVQAKRMTEEGFDYDAIQVQLLGWKRYDPLFSDFPDVEARILEAQAIIREAEELIQSTN